MSRPALARWTAAAWLVFILLLSGAAPWLAPQPPDRQEDVAGARFLPPLTRAHALELSEYQARIVTSLRGTPSGWEFLRGGRRGQMPATQLRKPPSPRFYLLGTDSLGRDLASRLLFGTRHSVGITFLSVVVSLFLGVAVGGAAGLAGGRWEALLMRGVDVIRCIPRLLLFLVCASLFDPSTLLLVLVLGTTTWTSLARIVRAEMLALRQSDLAAAARAVGSPPLRTLLRHLLPQIGPVLAVNTSLRFADTLLLESALSLLGLGAPPPAISLGGIIASGRDALAEAWWVAAWPGILITTLVLAVRSTATGLFRIHDLSSVA